MLFSQSMGPFINDVINQGGRGFTYFVKVMTNGKGGQKFSKSCQRSLWMPSIGKKCNFYINFTRKLQLATPFQTLKRMIVKTVLRFLSDCLLSHLRKTNPRHSMHAKGFPIGINHELLYFGHISIRFDTPYFCGYR